MMAFRAVCPLAGSVLSHPNPNDPSKSVELTKHVVLSVVCLLPQGSVDFSLCHFEDPTIPSPASRRQFVMVSLSLSHTHTHTHTHTHFFSFFLPLSLFPSFRFVFIVVFILFFLFYQSLCWNYSHYPSETLQILLQVQRDRDLYARLQQMLGLVMPKMRKSLESFQVRSRTKRTNETNKQCFLLAA